MTFDGKAFGIEIVTAVKAHVADVLGPVLGRLDALEKRLTDIPTPKDGKDADEDAVAARVSEKMAGELAAIRALVEAIQPAPELPDVAGMIGEVVAAMDEQREADAAQVKSWMEDVDARIEALPVPKDGKDADPDEMRAAIAAEVDRVVAAIPAPQDGKSVTVDELRPLVEESVSKAVAALPAAKDGQPGKDGVGLAGAIIDREGSLVVTLTDGTTRDLGPVVGKDGETGKPGKDGFSLSDFDASLMEDGRTVLLSFEQGDQAFKVELGIPAMIYRGVYKDGQQYEAGDTVTWGGSLWHCNEPTADKPDGGEKHWTLCAKKGRDGRDGVVKPDNGPPKVKV